MPAHMSTVTEAWNRRVETAPDSLALLYFDRAFTTRELDLLSTQTAAALSARGISRHHVVGIAMQNCPQFVVSMLALWKLGATVLLINPMYRGEELEHMLRDAGATGIIVDARLRRNVLPTVTNLGIWVLATSSHRLQARGDERALGPEMVYEDLDLVDLATQAADEPFEPVSVNSSDCAFLTYTSGTTGPAKGAINTHSAVMAAAMAFAEVAQVTHRDRVLAMAPMFHITGAVINTVLALVTGSTLVMVERFQPDVVVEAIEEHQVTFTVASITAYLALASCDAATRSRFTSIRAFYSGGAPVAPATVADLQDRLGHYIHNVYGLTETTSGVVAVPYGVIAPVDPASGALSVGVSVPGTTVRVIDADGTPQPPGTEGELEIQGPSVIPGYWNNPEATAATFSNGALRTGDVAIIDDEGWVFVVDRLKDQINTSGYKVWPREVEDVLVRHPAVEQAAVVGQPDPYRGERVTAYVVLQDGHQATPEGLIEFTRSHLAPYKAPRELSIVDRLPTTLTGKVQRRLLREN